MNAYNFKDKGLLMKITRPVIYYHQLLNKK